MPSTIIRHPLSQKQKATIGFDPVIGFFADFGKRSYSAINRGYDHERPLWGALLFLVREGLFTQCDLEEALERSIYEREENLPKRQKFVLKVVSKLKAAAD